MAKSNRYDSSRQWYAIHTYSGYEEKVAESIRQRAQTIDMADKIFDAIVPKEKQVQIKNGKRKIINAIIFQGYVLVEMKLTDETWYIVRNTPGVTGFVGSGTSPTFDNGVPDDVFKKIVAVLRIAVPYTGMIMSTRESAKTRRECLEIGITQISGGSRTSVGGYVDELDDQGSFDSEDTAQFDVEDRRTLGEVVDWLIELGYVPSFCTACYREGRTGDRFMRLLKSGQIANCCQPNEMMTLKEFLIDYAGDATKAKGDALIEEKLSLIPNGRVREICQQHLQEIENGKRDFRF